MLLRVARALRDIAITLRPSGPSLSRVNGFDDGRLPVRRTVLLLQEPPARRRKPCAPARQSRLLLLSAQHGERQSTTVENRSRAFCAQPRRRRRVVQWLSGVQHRHPPRDSDTERSRQVRSRDVAWTISGRAGAEASAVTRKPVATLFITTSLVGLAIFATADAAVRRLAPRGGC